MKMLIWERNKPVSDFRDSTRDRDMISMLPLDIPLDHLNSSPNLREVNLAQHARRTANFRTQRNAAPDVISTNIDDNGNENEIPQSQSFQNLTIPDDRQNSSDNNIHHSC